MSKKNLPAADKLFLPQVTAQFPFALPPKLHLLLLGGRAPADTWLKATADHKILWAIDKGIEQFHRLNMPPQKLVGDADSGAEKSWLWAAENRVAVCRHPTAKDYTDTQLALFALADVAAQSLSDTDKKSAQKKCAAFAVLAGAFGGRLDHLFSTLFSAANAKTRNCLADEREAVFFVKSGEFVALNFVERPAALSLLPLTAKCAGVNVSGTRWELKAASLRQKMPFAVSNETMAQTCRISIKTGLLAVYLCFP